MKNYSLFIILLISLFLCLFSLVKLSDAADEEVRVRSQGLSSKTEENVCCAWAISSGIFFLLSTFSTVRIMWNNPIIPAVIVAGIVVNGATKIVEDIRNKNG